MIGAVMDGECLKSDSDFLPNQSCKSVDDGVDRISELPDEIIVVILSFLSLREAVTTSVLSSRWSDLWKHTRNLDFNTECLKLNSSVRGSSWDVERCKYIQLVNTVLQSHKALSLKEFRISFYVNKSAKCALTKWLEFVFSRQVESLELDFKCWDEEYKVVLELGKLLSESRICLYPQTDLIFFRSLKRLCLRCLKVSGEDIELFLRNCPLLEQLIIRSVTLTSDVDVCGTTLVLKLLEIRYCKGGKSIKVSAPNLTRISVDEQSGKLFYENVPKLVRVDFRIRGREYVVQHFAFAISCFISQLQILKLTFHHFQASLANGFPEMPNLKKLVVGLAGLSEHGFMPVTALIWASPRLQEFKLRFACAPPAYIMNLITNVERSMHQHLKVFKLRGACDGFTDHIVEFVTYISDNCVKLRKIIIDRPLMVTYDIRAEEHARDCLKQQLQGIVSHHIQLQFSEHV